MTACCDLNVRPPVWPMGWIASELSVVQQGDGHEDGDGAPLMESSSELAFGQLAWHSSHWGESTRRRQQEEHDVEGVWCGSEGSESDDSML